MPHVHNALHHFIRVQAAYRAALGEADGAFTGIERAGETLTPTLNLWERPEWAFLRDEIDWTIFHAQANVAAEMGFVGIRNPAGSDVIAVIRGIRAKSTTAQEVSIRHGLISATDVDGSEDIAPRDTRYPLTGVGPLLKIHGAGAAQQLNDALEQLTVAATNLSVDFFPNRVLTPGFELRVYANTVNTALGVTMHGYMRKAMNGELG